MTALNRVQLVGNTGTEPKISTSKKNNEFVTLSIATNERVCRNDEWSTHTEWHNLVFFGKSIETAKKLKKGDQVFIEGKIRSNKWTDKEGVSRTAINIVVQHAHIINRSAEEKKQKNIPGELVEAHLEQMREYVCEPDVSVPF